MLRTLGIPTRLVTGYGPGERNPLTGYFEVQAVGRARLGRGAATRASGGSRTTRRSACRRRLRTRAAGSSAARSSRPSGRFLSGVMPESVKNLVRDAGLGVGVVRDGLVRAWPVVLAVLALLVLFVSSRRRRRVTSSDAGGGPRRVPRPDGRARAARTSARGARDAARVPPGRLRGPGDRTRGRGLRRRSWWPRSSGTGSPAGRRPTPTSSGRVRPSRPCGTSCLGVEAHAPCGCGSAARREVTFR